MVEVYKIMHNIYNPGSAPNLLKNKELSQRPGNRATLSHCLLIPKGKAKHKKQSIYT